MKKVFDYLKERKTLAVFQLLTAIGVILFCYFTKRYTYRKLSNTAAYLPILLNWLMFLPLILSIGSVFARKKVVSVISLLFNILSFSALFALFGLCVSKLTYFFLAGTPYFIAAGLVLVLIYLFTIDRLKIRTKKAVAWISLPVILLTIVMGVFNLRPFKFDSEAVVFAVEDEYQICWITSVNSTGCVKVGDNIYTDSSAGTYNVSRIHKVIVPRNALDENKEYEICSKNILNNRAYLTVSTKEISKKYTFRLVDVSDGFQIYNLSDNHLFIPGAIKAADYWKDDLDLIIANGDHLNDVSATWQFVNMYELLSAVSKSSRPIIITRGNHEAIGSKLAELPSFIGSYNGNFYYKVRFADILFVVFDVGNDMADDDKTIKNTADFALYRQEEIDWFKAEIAKGTFEEAGITRIIGVSHIPFIRRLRHRDFAGEMVELTNSIGMDYMVSGHYHNANVLEPETRQNPAAYPVIVGSVRSDDDLTKESLSFYRFTGTAIEIKDGKTTVRFTNSKGEVKGEYVIE